MLLCVCTLKLHVGNIIECMKRREGSKGETINYWNIVESVTSRMECHHITSYLKQAKIKNASQKYLPKERNANQKKDMFE